MVWADSAQMRLVAAANVTPIVTQTVLETLS